VIRRLILSLPLVLISVLLPGKLARAQGPVPSLGELRTKLLIGEKVQVTDSLGKKFEGKFDGVSGGSLRLIVDDTLQEFQQSRIREVTKRRPESRWDGALIGLGIGLVVGTINITSLCNHASERDDCFAVGWVFVLPIYAGAGAGSGALIDFAIKKHDTVFAAAGESGFRIGISPIASKDRKGIALSVAF
jgi:hypothetical protein